MRKIVIPIIILLILIVIIFITVRENLTFIPFDLLNNSYYTNVNANKYYPFLVSTNNHKGYVNTNPTCINGGNLTTGYNYLCPTGNSIPTNVNPVAGSIGQYLDCQGYGDSAAIYNSCINDASCTINTPNPDITFLKTIQRPNTFAGENVPWVVEAPSSGFTGTIQANGVCLCSYYQSNSSNEWVSRQGYVCQYSDNDTCTGQGVVDYEGNCDCNQTNSTNSQIVGPNCNTLKLGNITISTNPNVIKAISMPSINLPLSWSQLSSPSVNYSSISINKFNNNQMTLVDTTGKVWITNNLDTPNWSTSENGTNTILPMLTYGSYASIYGNFILMIDTKSNILSYNIEKGVSKSLNGQLSQVSLYGNNCCGVNSIGKVFYASNVTNTNTVSWIGINVENIMVQVCLFENIIFGVDNVGYIWYTDILSSTTMKNVSTNNTPRLVNIDFNGKTIVGTDASNGIHLANLCETSINNLNFTCNNINANTNWIVADGGLANITLDMNNNLFGYNAYGNIWKTNLNY